MTPHFVYTIWGEQETRALYVGCTSRPKLRIDHHHSRWTAAYDGVSVSMEGPFDQATARGRESDLILDRDPERNLARPMDRAKVHELVVAYEAGATIEALALDYGHKAKTVRRALLDGGATIRQPGGKKSAPLRPKRRPYLDPQAAIVRPSVVRGYR